jgi:16S rRNA (cytosine967-C5)-methyltransferase
MTDPFQGSIRTVRDRSVVHGLKHVAAVMTELKNPAFYADRTLENWFSNHKALGGSDRALIADVVYALIRWQRRVEMATSAGDLMSACATLLTASGYTPELIAEATGVSRESIAESATRFLALDPTQASDPADLAVRASLPEWIAERLTVQYGFERTREMACASRFRAPVTLRVNTLKTTRETVISLLNSSDIAASLTTLSPWGITLSEHRQIRGHRVMRDALVDPQDEGSQLLAMITGAQPGEAVVDACAGAGGKTLALAMMMENDGAILAVDTGTRKLRELERRARRSHVDIVRTERAPRTRVPADWRGSADRVLIDAPCSGSGTWRRIPDGPDHLSPSDLSDMANLQRKIIETYAPMVRPGGRLVYATCSLFAQENAEVVEAWIVGSGFEIVPASECLPESVPDDVFDGPYLSITPEQHGTDGFFAAVMVRTG